jgi:hypothetical protein
MSQQGAVKGSEAEDVIVLFGGAEINAKDKMLLAYHKLVALIMANLSTYLKLKRYVLVWLGIYPNFLNHLCSLG